MLLSQETMDIAMVRRLRRSRVPRSALFSMRANVLPLSHGDLYASIRPNLGGLLLLGQWQRSGRRSIWIALLRDLLDS